MGSYSDRRRLPIRLHSEFSVAQLGGWLARAAGGLRTRAVAATNDARIVGTLMVIAAVALALEMSASFR
jgi:hypothetical protein